MGIVKIKPQDNTQKRRGSSSSTLVQNELLNAEKLLLQKAPFDIFYDDQPEVGSEHVMCGGQTCHVPYELYDLADLKKILSLEIWNDCLTEDERLSLAAFLPAIEEETFWITMKELLGGDNIFFNSPLEGFFTGLKGGLYNPQVTHLRESLKFFQRREYYHCLRSYHESMTQKFVDMKKTWNEYEPSNSVEERIHVWNNRKRHKPVFLVDLNAYPQDDTLNKSDKNMEIAPFTKKKKHMNDSRETKVTPNNSAWNEIKLKSKGVLKIKPVETNLMPNYNSQSFTTKAIEQPQHVAKGVLKIKPKYFSNDRIVARNTQEITSADLLRFCDPRISKKYDFQRKENGMPEKLLSLYQIEKDKSTTKKPEFVYKRHSEEISTFGSVSLELSQKCEADLNFMKSMRSEDAMELCAGIFPLKISSKLQTYCRKGGKTGKLHDRKGFGKQPTAQLGSFTSVSSKPAKFESFHDGYETYQDLRANNSNLETSLSILTSSINKHQFSSDNAVDLNHGLENQTSELKTPSGCMNDLRFDKDSTLPITYKRKKSSEKLNIVEPLKQQPSIDNAEPANYSGLISVKPKSIKIKFKGLSGYSF